MQYIELKPQPHDRKIGDPCPVLEPNITEDTIFMADGKPIGFFLKKLPEHSAKLAELANVEFRSDRVPKQSNNRGTKEMNAARGLQWVQQYSTILGGIPPKPHVRRSYRTVCSTHGHAPARNFIKAMLLLAADSIEIIKNYMPEQYEIQRKAVSRVDPQWRLNEFFTSSISNCNIAAAFHQDRANILDTVNVIITKRHQSQGGNLHIPDYNATISQGDNSMVVYPAWRNMHGVTPIQKLTADGYRNSLVFYCLRGLMD